MKMDSTILCIFLSCCLTALCHRGKKVLERSKKNRYSIERTTMLIWCIEDMKGRYVEIMQIRITQTHAMVL